MVRSRQGIGGTQPQEVRRLLASARQSLDSERTWRAARGKQLADADAALETAFQALAGSAPPAR